MNTAENVRASYRAGMADGQRDVLAGLRARPAESLAMLQNKPTSLASYVAGYVQSYKDDADKAGRLALEKT